MAGLHSVALTGPWRTLQINENFSRSVKTLRCFGISAGKRRSCVVRARDFHYWERTPKLNCSNNKTSSSSSEEDDHEQGPPQEAVLKAISEVSKTEGRVGETRNVVIVGTVADDSTNEWLALDQKIDHDNENFSSRTPTQASSLVSPSIRTCHFPVNPQNQIRSSRLVPLHATLNSPKGFGPSPKKNKRIKKSTSGDEKDEEEEEEDEDEFEADAGVIPEVVTNRMISRMGLSVGIPLFIGLLFFPFFYYLKVVLKIDVPTWVPFIVSFFFFGTALLGVSYGIVSSSWDPLREGSLLGWTEAQRNWPVFWQSIWGGSRKK